MSILPFWVKPLLAGLLVVGLWMGVHWLDASRQKIGYDRAQTEYTAAAKDAQLKYEREARNAAELLRTKEQKLADANRRITDEYLKQKAAAAAADVRAADSLRRLEAALGNPAAGGEAPAGPASSSRTDDPRDSIIAESGRALQGLDSENKRLQGKVGALQRYASEVCLKSTL